jgi:formate-dependent nitrite reductase membrane component NrfD
MSQPASHPPSPGAQTLPTAGRPTASHWSAYPRFLLRVLNLATDGSPLFYVWMFVLTAIALVGANTWATQATSGMAITHLSDHVSWGLYIANFTFLVGLAAGGVMMVIPAYLYDDHDMHDVVIIGELLAVAALVMRLGFVVVDLGRPDRFWHILPGVGRFNWPISMLTWDVIVLNGYLLLNLHICGYLLYMRWLGRRPDPRWYLPFVFISIAWAISIHTVTAFLYAGLGGRPLWNSALLAPRFLASAFVVGPAFVLLTMKVLDRVSTFRAPSGPGAPSSGFCASRPSSTCSCSGWNSSPSSTRGALTRPHRRTSTSACTDTTPSSPGSGRPSSSTSGPSSSSSRPGFISSRASSPSPCWAPSSASGSKRAWV